MIRLVQDDTPSVGVGPVAESPVQENPIEELLQDGTPGSGGTPTVGGTPTEGATDEEETNQEKPAEKILEGDTPSPGEMPTVDGSDGKEPDEKCDGKGIAEDGLIVVPDLNLRKCAGYGESGHNPGGCDVYRLGIRLTGSKKCKSTLSRS